MKELSGVIEFLCSIDDPKEMNSVLEGLLTESERKDLSLRWALMEELLNNVSQRDIASKLGISLCKITRGAKVLKNKESAIYKWLQDHKREIIQE